MEATLQRHSRVVDNPVEDRVLRLSIAPHEDRQATKFLAGSSSSYSEHQSGRLSAKSSARIWTAFPCPREPLWIVHGAISQERTVDFGALAIEESR
jgi:hypothetical protein